MATAQLGTLMRHIKGLAAGPAGRQPTDRQLLDDFASRRDDGAFTTLMERHGPMVLRVCRRVLGHEQDAEDAFQATFLVLARNTASIRRPEALVSWLYGVAYRTAMRAKRTAARRRNREARLRERTPTVTPSPTWDDVQAVLDEEVQRLPESVRSAFVLCVLNGKTERAAAAELGVKEGTLSWRVTRARQRLRKQLTRRGIQLSALLGALSLAQVGSRAAVPAALARSTIGLGLSVAAGEPAAAIPSHVAALAAGVTRAMFLTKTKIAAALLLAAGLFAAGAGVLRHQTVAAEESKDPPAPPAAKTPPRPPAAEAKPLAAEAKAPAADNKDDKEPIAFSGRVLDPDGKPFAGAKLHVLYWTPKALPVPARAASDAEGRFRFDVPRADFDRSYTPAPWDQATVVAVAAGFGLGIQEFPGNRSQRTDITIRLVKDVPLTGRVLDLQGKPIAGVAVRVQGLHAPRRGDLAEFVKGLKEQKELFPPLNNLFGLTGGWMGRDVGTLFPPVTSGADGRFALHGIGGERVADLRIEGPTIATRDVYTLTRPGETIRVPGYRRYLPNTDILTVCGNGFDFVAAPCKPIVGFVRDKDTGKPIPGAVVTSYKRADSPIHSVTDLRAVADKEGRYRLLGMPKGEGNIIRAGPSESEPYLMATEEVVNTPGLEPVTVDFGLKRGVWLTGRVLDKATRQPVHSQIEYVIFADNPHRREAARLSVDMYLQTRAEDGSFRTVALPGRGLLAARAVNDRYRLAVGADAIKDLDPNGHFHTYPHLLFAQSYHVLMEINPAPDAKEVACDLLLDPGRTVKGEVRGPDGKPLAGVRVSGLRTYGGHGQWENEPLKTPAFTVTGLAAGEVRLLQFTHDGKKLAGSFVLKGDEKGPLTVELAAAATLVGRLVTPDGQPIADGNLTTLQHPLNEPDRMKADPTVGSFPGIPTPDKQGKVRLEGLTPGLTYYLGYIKGNYLHQLGGAAGGKLTFKPGETKDLGDIVVKPFE
jgi:RNA polymerase sigma factor (sigma-70 family)